MGRIFLLSALPLLLLASQGFPLCGPPSPEHPKLILYPDSRAKALLEERKWARALEELETLRARSREPVERSLLDFLMGYASFEAGLYDRALLSLSREEAGLPLLEEHALYMRASSYLHLARWEEAQEAFERLLARHPRGVRAKGSLVGLAEALDGRGHFREAASLYRRFLRQYPEAEEATYVQYRLAESLEAVGEERPAALLLRKLWVEKPLASEAPQARRQEEALSRTLVPPLPRLTAGELFHRGMTLKKAYRCREAIEDFKASLGEGPTRPMRGLIELEQSLCHFMLRQNNEAKKLLTTFIRNNPGDSRVSEALYYLARVHLRQDSVREFLRTVRSLMGRKGAGPWAPRAAFLLGRYREDRGDLRGALKHYRQILRGWESSDRARRAWWRIGWIHYRRGNYLSAWSTFGQMGKRFHEGDLLEDALYWEGRSAERLGKPVHAASAYRRLLSSNPYSYYGQLARIALERLGIGEVLSSPGGGLPQAPDPKSMGPALREELRAARLLKELGLFALEALHLERLPEEPYFRYQLAWAYHRGGQFHLSTRILRDNFPDLILRGRGLRPEFWQMAYPVVFKGEREPGLDPLLVNAMIMAESGFDPESLSWAGAIGLMQLMPATGRRQAARIGVKLEEEQELFDPQINIRLGVAHLKELLSKFGGAVVPAVASYNAGRGVVARWWRARKGEDLQEFIARIPYQETRHYVQRVLAYWGEYQRIYSESQELKDRMPSGGRRKVGTPWWG